MNLKEIMAIAGKPGLYKMIAQAKNGIVVESIIDQKRLQAFTHDKVSTLEEISIYTESGDKPLKEVLQVMYNNLEGKPAPENKGDSNKVKQFFGEMLPDYDKERVYVSHMQKIISWYNILLDHNLIDLLKEEEPESNEEIEVSPETTAEVTEEKSPKPKAKTPSGKKKKETE
jgi:hypothetical protein